MLAFLPMLALMLSALVIGSDFYARRVPNLWLLCILSIAAAYQVAMFAMNAPSHAMTSVLGLLAGLCGMLPFYAMGVMGAGDVKFMATLGFLLGAKALLPIWLIGCLLTGVHAVVVLVQRQVPIGATHWFSEHFSLSSSPAWQAMQRARQGRQGLPHAAYLAIGTITTILLPNMTTGGFR